MSRKCILEEKPEFGLLYYRIKNSKNLKDILERYEGFPDYTTMCLNDFGQDDFNFLKNIDAEFLNEVEDIIKKINLNLNNLHNDDLDITINKIVNYINCIINFIGLSCNFTNKDRKSEMIKEVSSRLSSLLPEELYKIIKISQEEYTKMNNRVSEIKRLVALANKYDVSGDSDKASKIDSLLNKIALELQEDWGEQDQEMGDPAIENIFFGEDSDLDVSEDLDVSDNKTQEILSLYEQDEGDILDNPGDPFKYIYVSDGDYYVVASAPEKNTGAIGYKINRGTEAYNVLNNRHDNSVLGGDQESVNRAMYGDLA